MDYNASLNYNYNASLIGREKECKALRRSLESRRSELVIVYGRRRIGKTYLVESFFNNEFAFKYVGIRGLRSRDQLVQFGRVLSHYSGKGKYKFADWFDAFYALEEYLETLPKGKKVVFIDEMPWMDSTRSNFVVALENFWNGWAMSKRDIMLIATGSATTWMRDKLIGNKGGLHARITCPLHLSPFTLRETELYLKYLGIPWDRYQILQSYMVLGGVPFYYSILDHRLSLAQNIDTLFFDPDGQLRMEFDELYNAIFKYSNQYIAVVEVLSRHKSGMSYSELAAESGISGTQLSRVLKNLNQSDFIDRWRQYGNKKREKMFRLTDFYTLFYYRFVEPNDYKESDWWVKHLHEPTINSWMGEAFEMICMRHLEQIKHALGLSVISTESTTWRYQPKKGKGKTEAEEKGGQIDMVIERADRIIHLCEIKFWKEKYPISKEYEMRIREREELFREKTKNSKALVNTFITTYGVKNAIGHSIVDGEVTMDNLFEQ